MEEAHGQEHELGLDLELAARHRAEGGFRLGAGDVEGAHGTGVVAGEPGGGDREVLLSATRAAGLVHGVGEPELRRPQRPRGALVGALGGRLGQKLELGDRDGALAHRVAHAVGARVAAADDHHALARRGDVVHRRRRDGGSQAGDLARHPTVARVQVVHGEVDALELAARRLQVARDARAGGDHHRVEAVDQLLGVDVDAHVHAAAQLDALVDQLAHAPLHRLLLDLEVGHPEAAQAAGGLVALVEHDAVSGAAQLLRRGHARRSRADHGHAATRLQRRWLGADPALLPRPVDDRVLDLLDRDGVALANLQHAGGLARCRAQTARELREVVGRVQLGDGVAPAVTVDEVVPVGDQVAERAAVVAEGHTALHAASPLAAQLGHRRREQELVVVADALAGVALRYAPPLPLQKSTQLTHGRASSPGERPCGRVRRSSCYSPSPSRVCGAPTTSTASP